jgi:hypothetical protein
MTIIDQAKEIIEGDREQTYGNPGINLKRIADQWSCYLNQKHESSIMLSEEDVCWMMVLLKMARQMHSHKSDNLVDAIGYVALIDKVGNRGTV